MNECLPARHQKISVKKSRKRVGKWLEKPKGERQFVEKNVAREKIANEPQYIDVDDGFQEGKERPIQQHIETIGLRKRSGSFTDNS